MKYDWEIDLDIKGFFDNIDHKLLMKAVKPHTQEKHILLYVERFLKADVQLPDGSIRKNTDKGTPQSGVISPLLAIKMNVLELNIPMQNTRVIKHIIVLPILMLA